MKTLENGLIEYAVLVPFQVTMRTGYAGETVEETLLSELAEFGGALADYVQYDMFPQHIVNDCEEMLVSHKESYGHGEDCQTGEVSINFFTLEDVPPEDVSLSHGVPVYSKLYGLWVLLQVADAHIQLMQADIAQRVRSQESIAMRARLRDIAKLSEGY